jgi:hypothetical protein
MRSVVTTAALLAGLAVPGVLAAAPAAAGPALGCAYDRPCIEAFYYAPSTGRLNARWLRDNDYELYNVRWTVDRGGRVGYFGQHEVRGTLAKLPVRRSDRGHPFTVSVQGCNTRFLAPSVCSPWESSTLTPVR